jgi:hypothetical protein
MPKDEGLADFLRNTGPPEPKLPPSPATPKALRDTFTGGIIKKMSRSNVKNPEPQFNRSDMRSPEPRGVDHFEAAAAPPRVMSPTPSTPTIKRGQLDVNLPFSSLMGSEDYFNENSASAQGSRRNSMLRSNPNLSEISAVPSRIRTTNPIGSPREPIVPRAQTTESLAKFLRTTGPSDFSSQSPPKVVKKSKSGFFRRLLGGGNNNDKNDARSTNSGSTSGRFTPITIPAIVGN